MNQALVTGASGFIGAYLTEVLCREGCGVTCLVRKTSRTDHLEGFGCRFVQGDVTDRESLAAAVRNVDVVFHLAGLTKAFGIEALNRVNEQGTRNLVEACAGRAEPPVLVAVSSLAAAGPSRVDRPRQEDDRPQPVSSYGRSKLAGERVLEQYCRLVPTTIIRPPIVFGGGDRASLEMFKPIALTGVHVVPGFADQRMSVIHAADLSDLLIRAAQRGQRLAPDEPGKQTNGVGYYFAGGGEDPTYAQLGRMIGTALGRRRVWVMRLPRQTVWGVAAFNELFGRIRRTPPVLGFDKAREALAGSWTCTDRRARQELGYAPAASLADRLAESVQLYRSLGWL